MDPATDLPSMRPARKGPENLDDTATDFDRTARLQ